MRHHPNPRRRQARPLVHVATGYAIRVGVSRGRLAVEDGVGRERRRTEYGRTDRLSRLVIHGSTGSVTLDAIRWLTATHAAFIHIDHAGTLQATTSSLGSDNPPLRRTQALASTNPVGITISRALLDAKLAGQERVVASLDAEAADLVARHHAALQECQTLDDLRLAEAQAAAAYWSAWRGIRVQFTTRDAARVPVHWTSFTQRASMLTGTPRVAVDPTCAILNYLYAILEAESRIALLSVGLDPGLGILHTDQRSRDSLALDLMEAGRPAVDQYVLDLLAYRPLSLKDVHETSTGQCRLLPRLARDLASTAPVWASEIAPHAEAVASTLAVDARLASTPTPLAGQTRRGDRPSKSRTRPASALRSGPGSVCRDCGGEIAAGQKRCAGCHADANAGRLRRMQAAEAQRRQTTGRHPSEDVGVRGRISQTQRARWAAKRATGEGSGFTGRPSEFNRLIRPRLAGASPTALARATGLSPGYCASIRDGKRIPDVRHWAAFQLAGLTGS
jgi:CRISPR-associated endonuclease Cas1